ncbi:hypothetical protein DY000_02014505 [Brassica cretica]|uniref:Uncharacterized protein n=1 Tax=Brassica cretica TaxID=69181 RepID=A0ABQ7D5Z8_BRACR|nr:hypothetical protein DY000_02014505 [Brassica cretica]
MWTVWSLENDLVTRRLHEDPGSIGDGGTEALLGSLDRVLGSGGSCQTMRSGDRGWNPEVSVIGPGGRMRIQGFSLRSGDRIGTLVYLDPEVVVGTRRSFGDVMTPIRRSLVGTRRFFEVVMTPMRPGLHRGTVLRLPRQDYYRYLFGFRILPLGSWPLSSSDDVFYFFRKSLTSLEGAGVGVMTQVPGLRCFPRLEKQDLDCSLYFTVLLQ